MNDNEIDLLEVSENINSKDQKIYEDAKKQIRYFLSKDSFLSGQVDPRITINFIDSLRYSINREVRCLSAYALGHLGDQNVVSVLIQFLNDTDDALRAASAYAIGELAAPMGVEPLLQRLNLENVEYVKGAVAEALGKLHDDRAIRPLLDILTHGSDICGPANKTFNKIVFSVTKGNFEESFANLKSRTSELTDLGHIIGGDDWLIFRRSIEPKPEQEKSSFTRRVDHFTFTPGAINSGLQSGSHILSRSAYALSRFGEAVIESLLNMLHTDMHNEQNRLVATYVAGAIEAIDNPASALHLLLADFNDENPYVRWVVARLLRKCPGPETVDALISKLNDMDSEVILAAAWSLGCLNATKAGPSLLKLLKERLYPEPNTRVPTTMLTNIEKRNITLHGGLNYIYFHHTEMGAKILLASVLTLLNEQKAIPLIVEVYWDPLQLESSKSSDIDYIGSFLTNYGLTAKPYLEKLLSKAGEFAAEVQILINAIDYTNEMD